MALRLSQTCIRYWVDRLLKATSLLALLLVVNVHADVLSCTDAEGKALYTDNRARCKGYHPKTVEVDVRTHSSQVNEEKVNYHVPARQYDPTGISYKVYIERGLRTGDSKLADAAVRKLEVTLSEIFSVLPRKPEKLLSQLTFYLMWGESSPSGGRKSGMSYIRPGEPKNYPYLDPRWENVIVIYSAKNLMYLDALWSKKALMHELAHAWHLNNFPENYEPIVSAYRNAKNRGLYRSVKDINGKALKEAYAIKNHLEYFAELSAIHFVGGNYFPENSNVLRVYDVVGSELVQRKWGGL